jgi:hypothetical protein
MKKCFQLFLFEILLFSCDNNEVKTEPIKETMQHEPKIESDPKFKCETQADFVMASDIKRVFELLIKEKLIPKNPNLNPQKNSGISYLSPSTILSEYTIDLKSDLPDSLHVLSYCEYKSILKGNQLKEYFEWRTLTGCSYNPNSYPQYHVFMPLFSFDKKKFIVIVEKYISKDCFEGTSWLFINKKNRMERHRFDEVKNCN